MTELALELLFWLVIFHCHDLQRQQLIKKCYDYFLGFFSRW